MNALGISSNFIRNVFVLPFAKILIAYLVFLSAKMYSESGYLVKVPKVYSEQSKQKLALRLYGWPTAFAFVLRDTKGSSTSGDFVPALDSKQSVFSVNWLSKTLTARRWNLLIWCIIGAGSFVNLFTSPVWRTGRGRSRVIKVVFLCVFAVVLVYILSGLPAPSILQFPIAFGVTCTLFAIFELLMHSIGLLRSACRSSRKVAVSFLVLITAGKIKGNSG